MYHILVLTNIDKYAKIALMKLRRQNIDSNERAIVPSTRGTKLRSAVAVIAMTAAACSPHASRTSEPTTIPEFTTTIPENITPQTTTTSPEHTHDIVKAKAQATAEYFATQVLAEYKKGKNHLNFM